LTGIKPCCDFVGRRARVKPDRTLADTPHPARLGSPLTHPHITTDFGESRLELTAGAHADGDACLEEINQRGI